jgi:hypothetical protein
MRQGQQNNKRMRGRNRKGPNPLARTYESNGPDVKVRGTALHIAEKYVQLARDAQSSGDRVQAENYLQHAEHYYRIVSAAQAQMPQQQQQIFRNDVEGEDEDDDRAMAPAGGQTPYPQLRADQPAFGPSDPQPYVNGHGNGSDHGDDQPESDEDGEQPAVAEAQPEAGESAGEEAGRAEGDAPPREGRSRSRRRRPYRDRADRTATAEGAPQPENAGAGGEE